MQLDGINKIYFIGIGGIGMSAVAGLAKEAGFEVAGSDRSEVYEPSATVLKQAEINYHVGYKLENISSAGADLYIVSAGEDRTNPEVNYLIENGLEYFSFSELAGELAKDKIRVVVTGTNGKSTTAGWLGSALKNIDDSSFMVGAVLKNENTNFHSGSGHYFVFEGDEYRATFDDPTPKFHYYRPDIAVLNNLEYDHPDIFESLEAIKIEFAELLAALPEDGLIIYNADDQSLNELAYNCHARNFSFAIDNPADVRVAEINYLPQYTEFTVLNSLVKESPRQEKYRISLAGELNVRNALAIVTTLRALGFNHESVALHLASYAGVKRRFEVLGQHNGITIIDDYAHHPTAVARTLEAARTRYPSNTIWAIFEPHTFSRTKATLPDLAKCFSGADKVIISDIYPARENAKTATISSDEVVKEVSKHHKDARLVHSKAEALSLVKSEAKPGDVVIIMAVGDFFRLGYEILEAYGV